MMEDNKTPNYAIVTRLGKVFEKQNLDKLCSDINEAGLPIIPYNATIDELNRLLEYIGCQYMFVQDSIGILKSEKYRLERERQKVYSEVYRNTEARMAGATKETLRLVTEASKKVLEMDDKITELNCQICRVENRLAAYAIADQDVRKRLSSEMQARGLRMD